MNIFLALALLACTQARIIDDGCDGFIINNVNHEQEVLLECSSPYQLAIDYDTNTLFYSYNNADTTASDIFLSGFINLKTNESGVIKGVAGGFANAVDNKKHKVYLGGRDGIYEVDFNTKTAKHAGVTSDNIWQLFYKDGLYYSKYPDEAAYLYKNGVVTRVQELENTKAMLIAVDNDQNIFFSNSSGLFCYKRETDTYTMLGTYNVNGFTADIDGNLYFSTPDGIYSIDGDVKQLLTTDNVYGVAIQGDNSIIVALHTVIVRLKSTGKECNNKHEDVSMNLNNL